MGVVFPLSLSEIAVELFDLSIGRLGRDEDRLARGAKASSWYMDVVFPLSLSEIAVELFDSTTGRLGNAMRHALCVMR
jgi:hypothetical protein